MVIQTLPGAFSVCTVPSYTVADLDAPFSFTAKTDNERSLICLTENVPQNTMDRTDGWRGFRIAGVLDFSLIGILAAIAAVLAQAGVEILAVSSYQTDYVFIKAEKLPCALAALQSAGYAIEAND
ncbi:MAG: ACT domain-containing protein [Clostridia bacterium]|nr:ACT domain-containing protein [Clostridia bacterium]MBQ9988987.1 ACT domain-containing protein [Clostridia bacterium]